MEFTIIPRTWRHLRRYNQVIRILLKYGFDDVVDAASKDLILRFGEKFIPRLKSDKKASQPSAQRLRNAIEELGPTFIKIGQILSMRPDIIPPEIAYEFQKLQDDVAPIPFEEIEKVIRDELKSDPYKIFPEINKEPLAAASIAQVHRAKLKEGKDIVLKVQRPSARAIIDVDIEILSDLARILNKYFQEKLNQDPAAILDEFDKSIHRELDFIQEGKNISRFKRYFADDPTVFFPSYYSEYSTSNLLVMDYVDGIKASNIDVIEKAGLDRKEIAKRGTCLSFKQIFEFGFFHADPHSGNMMVLPGNVIAPLDFGMVGQIDEVTIDHLGDLIAGGIRKDIRRIVRALEHLGIIDDTVNVNALKADITKMIYDYYGVPLKELQLNILMNEFYEIIQSYRLTLPVHLSLALKALLTAEGLGRLLYPEFDAVSELRPYLGKIIMRRYDPTRKFKEGLILIDDLALLAEELPKKTRIIINKAASGKFAIQFEHRNLEHLVDELGKSSNRLSAALIISALIIGSSFVIQAAIAPKLFGYPLIGVVGFLLASILGLKLIWDMFRNRKS
ncbi:MAG: AarF/ABC1/UbiB kinase family protein [Candidatus Marinimicrobia bacterium]|nr:AarF/ABC1/UbiB kinase family protein [Candidatus Neomarinimicrobiota bacterium]